ncbi:MAG: phenylalanine--tRNA ligase subunit beta [Ruminococcaceae bacterium]|nr:phenylalanine--tRNA ligase subunit beta [Oscillospiraceae bacterium]
MKVAMSWFNDFTDISDIEPKQYADALTMSGTMVEGVEALGAELVNVVTGKITEITKHENADSLQVCMLDVGNGEPLQIVTGATNVKVGQIVPVALHGAKLAGGVTIKKGKLRGVVSNGMLCSHEELGITVEDLGYEPEYGILILNPETPIGIDIKEVFGLNENVIEFEITSNRPDCQSVIGLARETAVTFNRPFNLKKPVAEGNSEDVNDFAKVDVMDKEYCPRYCARMVKNVKIGPSPAWMVKRLQASGIRSINNIVDITNYLLLEYGQPMHAFDLRDISGSHIIVRRANDGEKITTLDEVERTLDSSMLVIADEKRAVAVAGVMGALNSEVKEDTTTVLFESANFDGASVRVTAKKLGMRTEASAKYEKGLDANMTLDAVNRACELVEMLGAGEVVGGVIDVHGELSQGRTLDLCPDKINKFLGADISTEFMVDTLRRLDFEVDTDKMTVKAPTYRADIESQADLAEEIVRIYGYNNIESTLMSGNVTTGGKNAKQSFEDLVKKALTSQGMYEIMTYSFTNPNVFDRLFIDKNSPLRNVVTITNPLGEENSIMRTTTVSSMLEILEKNYKQRNAYAPLFEIGKIYIPQDGELLPKESEIVTLGMYGDDVDFYTIKGMVEGLFDIVAAKDYKFVPKKDNTTYHPGRCAEIYFGTNLAGYIGQIHPKISKDYGIDAECYVAELDFSMLFDASNHKQTYKKLPKYPAVSRDIAILVDDSVLSGDIEDIIKRAGGKLLDNVELFDAYKGAQIPQGKKSMAYSATFRADDRTLNEEEITKVMDKILKNLKNNLGAELR